MNSIVSYLIEVILTLVVCLLAIAYLRPFFKKILVDICGTEERAQFWTVFTNTLLLGLPLIISLSFKPEANSNEELFFEITRKLSGNLAGFLFAMIGTGIIIASFALLAPKTTKVEAK